MTSRLWRGSKALLAEARADVEQVAEEFRLEKITDGERYNRSVDLWASYTDRIWQATSQPKPAPQHDLMFSLVEAQAAGKRGNLRRLIAMPGCSAKPNGEILEVPVTQSFGEGLSPHEHFVDTRDLRAHTIRESSRRSRAAVIERRLYRALRGVKVDEDDCGATDGLRVTAAVEVGRVVRTVREQAEGLVASEPVRDRFGTVRMPRGARIEGEALDDVMEVWVRWPFKCRSRGGVCRVCSGGRTGLEAARALSAAAAVLPAETWLLNDFFRNAQEAGINTRTAGRLAWHNVLADPERVGFRVLAGGGHITIVNPRDARLTERYAVYPDQLLHFADGAEVESGACVAEVARERMTLAVLPPGESAHVDLSELPLERGWWTRTKPVRVWLRAMEGTPSWSPQPIEVGPRMSVKVENLALVQRGDCIAFGFGPRGYVITPPALTLLDALIEPSHAVVDRAQLAPCDGIVHVDWARSRVWISSGASKRLVRIRDLNTLEVQSGAWVACGDALTAGTPSPHDQLRVRGSEWLAASLAERLMREFGLERDATSLLHVGQLVCAMLSRVRVVRPQGTRLRKGVTVTREVWEAANVEASLRGRAPAVVVPVLTPLSVLGR